MGIAEQREQLLTLPPEIALKTQLAQFALRLAVGAHKGAVDEAPPLVAASQHQDFVTGGRREGQPGQLRGGIGRQFQRLPQDHYRVEGRSSYTLARPPRWIAQRCGLLYALAAP